MDIMRAREIIQTLADGVDPATGELLPKESVYNSPQVIRALYTILEATASSEKAKSPRNAGKFWNDAEDDKLRDEFADKLAISQIAQEHGRTNHAIERRLEHLGLKKRKPFWLFRKE